METFTKIRHTTIVRIRRSANYYHDEFSGLSKGVGWLALAQVVSLLASFALTLAFTHYLSKNDYGTFKYFFSIASILGIPTLPGMIASLTRATSRGNGHLYKTVLLTRLRYSSISAIIASVIALYYFTVGNAIYAIIALFIAFSIPLSGTFTTYRAYLSGKERFRARALAHMASRIFVTLCATCVAIVTGNILLTLIVFFISGLSINFFFTLLFPPQKTRPELSSILRAHPAITYGKHLSALALVSEIAEYADNIILFIFLGPGATAVYALAVAPVKRLSKVFTRFARPILVSRFSTHSPSELKGILPLIAAVLLVPAILFALLYFFLAPLVFQLLFPNYGRSIPLTQLASFAIVLIPLTIYNTSLISQMQTKRLVFQKISSRIFRLSAIALLTYLYGIIGTVGALIIFEFVNIMINITLFQTIKDARDE